MNGTFSGHSQQPDEAFDWTAGIVAILSLSGKRAVGTGFVASSDGMIVTCAHVLEHVFGTVPSNGAILKIRFKAGPDRHFEARVEGGWLRTREDVAIIRLVGDLPAGAMPLPLMSSRHSKQRSIHSFGHPDYSFKGLGGDGRIVEFIEDDSGQARLQLFSTQITHGYSGGPIWDSAVRHVVGLVHKGLVPDDIGRNVFTAIGTPAETVKEICPALTLAPAVRLTSEIQNNLTQGLGFYVPRYRTAVENFITRYLGTAENPVPFGGRDDALAELETWRMLRAEQRLLLAAPAGRGKSALLVRWVQQLTKRDDIAVIFVPISVRYETNLEDVTFTILATRLADLYGREIPANFGNLSPQGRRALVAEYLREPLPDGRQLLLILDGLDEAAWPVGANLFPTRLPTTVRIVASARYLAGEEESPEPWLHRLGWEAAGSTYTLTLDRLSKNGLRDVLRRTGPGEIEAGVIQLLYELTGGDPLLVELYVNDIWDRHKEAGRLTTANLKAARPGYAGYFDRWWDDQEKLWGTEAPDKERAVRQVINALAAALGPLTIDDLLELEEDLFYSSADVRDAVEPLRRFIVGDGLQQGYAYAHPKLGDYFWERLTRKEQRRWRRRFARWGKTTVELLRNEEIEPGDVSPYLLRHYSRHLALIDAPTTRYRRLLSGGWLQAWYSYSNTYAGFLSDVDQVWHSAHVENKTRLAAGASAPFLGEEILCALCHASVNSISFHISDALLTLLLQKGIWTLEQVLAVAREKPLRASCHALLRILEALPAGSADSTGRIARDVLARAQRIEDHDERSGVLVQLAPHVPEETLYAAEELTSRPRVEVLKALAPQRPQLILAAANQVPDADFPLRAALFGALLEHVAAEERNSLVQDIVGLLARPFYPASDRASLLAAVAPFLTGEQVDEEAQKIRSELRALDELWIRARALGEIAPHLPQEARSAEFEEILVEARWTSDALSRCWTMSAIAAHLPVATLAAAQALKSPYDRAAVLCALAPFLPAETLAAGSEIDSEVQRAEVLRAVAKYLPQETLAAAQKLKLDVVRSEVLSAVAPHLPQGEQPRVIESALEDARAIRDGWDQARLLSAIAPRLPQRDRTDVLQNALAAARRVDDTWTGVKALAAIASRLPDTQRATVLQEALAAAHRLERPAARAMALGAIIPHLPAERRAPLLERALSEARQESDALVRLSTVSSLAPLLQQERRERLVRDALTAVLQEQKAPVSADILRWIAPYLPQDALSLVDSSRLSLFQLQALNTVLPHLAKEESRQLLRRALAASREESLFQRNPLYKTKTLSSAARLLDGDARQELVDEALRALAQITLNSDRREALQALFPVLSDTQPQALLKEALVAAAEIADSEKRERILTATQSVILRRSPAARYDLWHAYLEVSTRRPRHALLVDLTAWLEIIQTLGGENTLRGTMQAVATVPQWWP